MNLGCGYKRIVKEIECNDQINNSDICYNITPTKNYKINFDYNNYSIYVELDQYYPFYPPKNIFINNKKYEPNCNDNIDAMKYIAKHYNINCLMCKSYLCNKNWSPVLRIIQVVDQCIHYEHVINSINKIIIIGENYNLSHDIEKKILSYFFENI